MLSNVRLFVTLWNVVHQLPCLWNFSGKDAGLGFHVVLQGVVLTQGSNLHLLRLCICKQSLPLAPNGAYHYPCIKFLTLSAVRLDLNYRKKIIKNSNIWRLNNTLLTNQQIIEEIKKEIKICIEMNENENTTTQNLWDTLKAVLRGRFIALQAYLKKQEKSQINSSHSPSLCVALTTSVAASSLLSICADLIPLLVPARAQLG